MLGAIIGDTVGSEYEFDNTKDYNFQLFTPFSVYTDDTVVSMAVAQWLLEDPTHSHQRLEDIMVKFGEEFPHPRGGYGGGFSRWLLSPNDMMAYESVNGPLPYESKTHRFPYGSWGNGSAMRVSAVGWFFDTLEETERVAKISAEITHNHPEGIKGAQATAAAIWMARNGQTKAEIKRYIENKYDYDLDRTWEYLNKNYDWDSSCQGTVPEAVIAFLESKNFEDAIRLAVSMGGDSDTLACITGGIAEAYYGGVPEDMKLPTERRFPEFFFSVLHLMRERTSYGKLKPNPECRRESSKPKLYMDIDGVLLKNHTAEPIADIERLISFIIDKYDCYWLTTHCKGDKQTALDYLSDYLPHDCITQLEKVNATSWGTFKTDAIDLNSDFYWLEDSPMRAEKTILSEAGKLDRLILVNAEEPDVVDKILSRLK